jgi:NAD(P) transhydrogenase subunit alpha
LLTPHVHEADVIITTAAIPGRPAPRLITAPMLKGMRSGSVIADLAAESGGNVEGSVAGADTEVKVADGTITLVGMKDAASTMPYDASRLYAKNVANLIALITHEKKIGPDFDDEVVAGACLTHDGEVRHEPTAESLKGTK